jgi:hypothetical protein
MKSRLSPSERRRVLSSILGEEILVPARGRFAPPPRGRMSRWRSPTRTWLGRRRKKHKGYPRPQEFVTEQLYEEEKREGCSQLNPRYQGASM